MKSNRQMIWVISDTHLGHKNLVHMGIRPEDFEQQILDSLSVIQPQDILIHLGDIAMKRATDNVAVLMSYLPPETKKILCCGNHDNKSNIWYINNGWTWACRSFSAKFFGRKLLFSHEPKRVRHPYTNIHGHTHGGCHRGYSPPGTIEIALEITGYKPLNLEHILAKNPLKELTPEEAKRNEIDYQAWIAKMEEFNSEFAVASSEEEES